MIKNLDDINASSLPCDLLVKSQVFSSGSVFEKVAGQFQFLVNQLSYS